MVTSRIDFDALDAELEKMKQWHTPDQICADISREMLDQMITGFEAAREYFRNVKGYGETHPSMIRVNERIEFFRLADAKELGGMRSSVDVSAAKLAEILSKHGMANVTPENAHQVADSMPRCWYEVEARIHARLLKQVISNIQDRIVENDGAHAICHVPDDRLSELEAPSLQNLKRAEACAQR